MRSLRLSGRFGITLLAGLVSGFLSAVSAVSYAALIVGQELTVFLPQVISITLVTGVVAGTMVALLSTYPGSIAVPQDRIAPILALLAGITVDALGPDASAETRLMTVAAAIILSTLLTGGLMLLIGVFRLGGLIRFIPYPVVGGFLAGTGWLLVVGSFGVMGIDAQALVSRNTVLEPTPPMSWVPGVIMALVLLIVLRRWRHFLVLPSALALTTVACVALIPLSGHDFAQAQALGWTLGPFPDDVGWRYLPWEAFHGARWDVLLDIPTTFATIAVVSVISLLLNATAMELVTARDIRLNHELRGTGAANLVSGLAGGMVGFLSISNSVLAYRMGARGRVLGVLAAFVCLLVLVVGLQLLAYMPRAVVGGLLLFLGTSFLYDWVVDGYRRLSLGDYLVVLVILVTIAIFGFLESVVIGLIGAICLFAVNYSRVEVVKQVTNAVERQSNVDRPPRHRRALKELGEHVHILRLQGFLFFGTANRLFTDLRARYEEQARAASGEAHEETSDEDDAPQDFVVLDFRRVSAMDSSAALSFAKIAQLAGRCDFRLVLCGLDPELERQLSGVAVDGDGLARARRFGDLDHAVEWCEDQLLANQTQILARGGLGNLRNQIQDVVSGVIDTERLMKYIDRLEIPAGEEFIAQGDVASDMYFIESGIVSINLVLDDGSRLRIRKMSAGTVTGELGLYLGGKRNACVVAESPAVVYRLSRTALDIMEEREPGLAAAFHKYMARLLSERLVQTNQALRGLLD